MSLYLKNATFVDWLSLEVKETHLAVEEGDQGGITFLDQIPQPGPEDRILDCRSKVVTRSFACGHHHIYSTLARGMPGPSKTPTNFVQILERVWWHLDKRLDKEMIRASALAAAVHCAKNGVTFVIDHHSSPFAVEGSLFAIARAFEEVGLSHLLCYEISDRDGEGPREAGLAETGAFLSAGNQGQVGLHASFTVGEQLLDRAVELAHRHGTGIHVHVAEDRADQDRCLAKYGVRVVERFSEAGVLDLEGTLLVHCLHLEPKERRLIKNSPAWVVQNTESNQNNNVGLSGYTWLPGRVLLGTDGLHSDMLRSAKAAYLAGQATEGLPLGKAYLRFRAVHRFLKEFGARGDGENNLVILDYDSPTELNSSNFLGHFLFGLEPRHVETVISQGRIIVEERRPTLVDQGEVLTLAREMGRKLWEKM